MDRIRETSRSKRLSDGGCLRRRRVKRGQTEKDWTWPQEVGSGWQEAWRTVEGSTEADDWLWHPVKGTTPRKQKKKEKENVGFNVPAGEAFRKEAQKLHRKLFFPLGSLHLTWRNSVLQEDIRQLSHHIKSQQEAGALTCWGEAQMSEPALPRRSLCETMLDFC